MAKRNRENVWREEHPEPVYWSDFGREYGPNYNGIHNRLPAWSPEWAPLYRIKAKQQQEAWRASQINEQTRKVRTI